MPRTRPAPSPALEVTDPDSPFASAPQRATGTLTLGFGLVSIPTQVFAGTEDSSIARHEYVERDGEFLKVGRASIIKDTGETIPTTDVIKAVEHDDRIIPLSDDEIAAAVGCEGGTAIIERFMPLSVMNAGTYIVDSLYQLRPAPGRTGRSSARSEATETAFTLLVKAMRLEGVFGLVKVALRGKPRYAAFMPDGRLYTLRYTNEVRLPRPMPDVSVSDSDLMLARMVVTANTSTFAMPLVDEAGAAVAAYVEAKAAESYVPAPLVERVAERNVTDLMARLRESVTGISLPNEQAPPRSPARRGPATYRIPASMTTTLLGTEPTMTLGSAEPTITYTDEAGRATMWTPEQTAQMVESLSTEVRRIQARPELFLRT